MEAREGVSERSPSMKRCGGQFVARFRNTYEKNDMIFLYGRRADLHKTIGFPVAKKKNICYLCITNNDF